MGEVRGAAGVVMNRGTATARMLAEPAPDALLLRGNIGWRGRTATHLLVLLSYLYCNFAGADGMFAGEHGEPARWGTSDLPLRGQHMKHGKTRLFALAAAHGASLLAVPPVLQAAETGQLEEIVVTARQREERIEDVPVSITAFTAAEIRSAGIQRPVDFIALTTGVSQVQTAEAGDLQVNIRGINTGRDSETNFALVIDGVLQTNPQALNQELSGITQIEVLKGPQGALYGRNALAGALILTTRKPGDEWDTELTAGYGSDNSYKGSFYMGGPLADGVRGSISAYTRKTDGQWRNLKNDCDDCVDRFEETGMSGRLLFEALGGTFDFKAKYSELDSGAINFNASIALADVAPFVGPAFYEDANKHNFRYINNVDPQNEQENINLSIKGDWDVGIGTLTSYLAYNDQTNFFLTDGTSDAFLLYALDATCQASNDANLTDPGYEAPFFGIPSNIWFTPAGGGAAGFLPPYGPSTCGGYQYQQRDQEDLSLEVRLTSPGDQPLRWVAGAYFADIDRHVVVSQGSDLAQGFKARPFVSTSGPQPDRPAVRRRLQQQGLRRVRPDRLRRDGQPRTGPRTALRQRRPRSQQQRAGLHRHGPHLLPRADAGLQLLQQPVHQPGLHGEPGLRDLRHPEPQRDVRSAAAEDLGELEAHRRLRVVRLLRLWLPQRRLQLVGQRSHRRHVLRAGRRLRRSASVTTPPARTVPSMRRPATRRPSSTSPTSTTRSSRKSRRPPNSASSPTSWIARSA